MAWGVIVIGQEHQNPADQFRVYFYLKQASAHRIPSDFILYIMDLAEYWLVSKTERWGPMSVTGFDGNTKGYLRSAPIVGNPNHPVRQIEYEITSHDQGFSDDTRNHGTYNGSYTWFHA